MLLLYREELIPVELVQKGDKIKVLGVCACIYSCVRACVCVGTIVYVCGIVCVCFSMLM